MDDAHLNSSHGPAAARRRQRARFSSRGEAHGDHGPGGPPPERIEPASDGGWNNHRFRPDHASRSRTSILPKVAGGNG